VVFGFGTPCLILMFFVSFLDLNMFVYSTVTCWDKKKGVCFTSQKYPFLGLGSGRA
jgi:hypothetical protein